MSCKDTQGKEIAIVLNALKPQGTFSVEIETAKESIIKLDMEQEMDKVPRWRKILKRIYYISIHVLAVFALFLIAVAVAVKFRWTNQSGSTDVNNRYFNGLSDKYGKAQTLGKKQIDLKRSELLQKIGLLARYSPVDAVKIYKAYQLSGDELIALRMFDAAALMLKKNKTFSEELSELMKRRKYDPRSVFEWTNYKVWESFCGALRRDKKAIDSVARITGVESRLIVMCLVGEQVRMFNSGRERFKQYVYPLTRVMLPNNRGYGVTSILEHTALRIERNLIDKNSPFYPGDYFYRTLNVKDSFPEVVVDTIKAHRHKTIQRLIKGGDHFYSYLYTAFLLRQYQAHWTKEGFDLSYRPEILGTLFNIGFHKSNPKKDPEAGGSSFTVGNKTYTFGGLCFEFYYSGELMEEFPMTSQPFVPVKELEVRNKSYLEYMDKLMKGDSVTVVQQ